MGKQGVFSMRIRLASQFNTFRKVDQFNDCVLISGNDQIRCQRLILSKYSNYFKRYFAEHPLKKLGDVCTVTLPVNPNNILDSFLQIIYENYLPITIQNIPPLLKMAVYYECPSLQVILKNFYLSATNNDTILYFAEKFIELDLLDDAKALAPQLAEHVKRIHNCDPTEKFSITDIYKSLSPQVFAAVFCQESLKFIPDHEKVRYIDKFVIYRGLEITDEKDREELASPINWSDASAYTHMVHYKCDWLPDKLARPLLNIILNSRRSSITKFRNEIKKSDPKVSRWYPSTWAYAIQEAKIARCSPSVDVVDFIRTLGGLAQPINPIKYGFIFIPNECVPLMNKFKPENAFLVHNNSTYYLANKVGNKMPTIGFDLKTNSKLKIESISIDSTVLKKEQKGTLQIRFSPKPSLSKVLFKPGDMNGFTLEFDKEKGGVIHHLAVNVAKPCSKVSFTMQESTLAGSTIMRISSIDVCGYFTNSDE
ncbi:BTB/POZ domain containing protein [Tritrichomonas foetus]|uniref:BTB/POZ domain containing protein n=1 Tax=Tritrichomonas foetus TaxID=1144522 RepID=A0A1J4KR70_9EUKA|nr:BTB/POZ domain containing protein [Tritrichomonas foetus]|eukprot:OHT12166.1 BTB/POZ domain containing protein [Tritrichomonas foetus]